jgi:hypothetical protein
VISTRTTALWNGIKVRLPGYSRLLRLHLLKNTAAAVDNPSEFEKSDICGVVPRQGSRTFADGTENGRSFEKKRAVLFTEIAAIGCFATGNLLPSCKKGGNL